MTNLLSKSSENHKSPNQGFGGAVLPLKALGEDSAYLSQLAVAPGTPRLPWLHPSKLCSHAASSSSLSVSSFSGKESCHWIEGLLK